MPCGSIQVEISGINRKQAEVIVNTPKTCSAWEPEVRSIIQSAISRGRISVSIAIEYDRQHLDIPFSFNETQFRNYMAAVDKAATLSGRTWNLDVAELSRLGIIVQNAQAAESTSDELWPLVIPVIQEALSRFLAMRHTEGEHLKTDILQRLNQLEQIRLSIASLAPRVPIRLRDAMMKRLEEAGLPIKLDDERIIREIALFADKSDITEELTRLASHFCQFRNVCDSSAPAGRPLDFLCQEIFREFNTIGSKANDAELAHLVVSAKTELEKIREQVQNIE